MKTLIYSLYLSSEGQQEEVGKCIEYLQDAVLAHNRFILCLGESLEGIQKIASEH